MALEDRGVGIKSNTIDAREGEQTQMMALVGEEGRIAGLEAEAATLEAKQREHRETYLDRLASELIDIDRSIGVMRQDLAKAQLMERSGTLRAPVTGRVQQVAVNTLGEVVQTGQRLMSVVPDGTVLEIEGMLANRDKGFVREGQQVRVKLEAFPFTRYGTLHGTVVTVSNDAIPAGAEASGAAKDLARDAAGPLVFPTRIALDATSIEVEGEAVALVPGMSVTAEVKTGSKRVLEFLLDPLIEMGDGAMHER